MKKSYIKIIYGILENKKYIKRMCKFSKWKNIKKKLKFKY